MLEVLSEFKVLVVTKGIRLTDLQSELSSQKLQLADCPTVRQGASKTLSGWTKCVFRQSGQRDVRIVADAKHGEILFAEEWIETGTLVFVEPK